MTYPLIIILMNKQILLKVIVIILLISIALIYSSDISFMPNYIDKGDKWHLFIPTLIFYPILILMLCWTIFDKTIRQGSVWLNLAALIGYVIVNETNGYFRQVGYCVIIALLIITTFQLTSKTKSITASK